MAVDDQLQPGIARAHLGQVAKDLVQRDQGADGLIGDQPEFVGTVEQGHRQLAQRHAAQVAQDGVEDAAQPLHQHARVGQCGAFHAGWLAEQGDAGWMVGHRGARQRGIDACGIAQRIVEMEGGVDVEVERQVAGGLAQVQQQRTGIGRCRIAGR